jgi:hypothetical protein
MMIYNLALKISRKETFGAYLVKMRRRGFLTLLTGRNCTSSTEGVMSGGCSLRPTVQITCSRGGGCREAEGRSTETAPSSGTATKRPGRAQVRRIGARSAVAPVTVGGTQSELAHVCRQKGTKQHGFQV